MIKHGLSNFKKVLKRKKILSVEVLKNNLDNFTQLIIINQIIKCKPNFLKMQISKAVMEVINYQINLDKQLIRMNKLKRLITLKINVKYIKLK